MVIGREVVERIGVRCFELADGDHVVKLENGYEFPIEVVTLTQRMIEHESCLPTALL